MSSHKHPIVIGLSGFKGSGKGVVASIFEERGYIKLSAASPLKDVVSILFGYNRDDIDGKNSRYWREQPDKEWQCLSGHGVFQDDEVITPRIILQRIGTDICRNHIHPDFWLLLLQKRIRDMNEMYSMKEVITPSGRSVPYRGVVIDDARFLNELSICDYTINIQRYIYGIEEIQQMHISEREHLQWDFDFILSNRGSISDLEDQIPQL